MIGCILEARNVDFSYHERRVLHQIRIRIPQGAFVSVVGPNGSGKSTLLRLLSGARSSEHGAVFYQGEDVSRMNISKRARLFAVVRQSEENQFPFTCLEMVMLGLHPHRTRFGTVTSEQMEHVRDVMEHTDTWMLCNQPVTEVSGGEFQRVVLARALVQKPRVLFLDEAMSDFDIRIKIRMTNYLREWIARSGMTVVAVNHDLTTAYQYSDQIIALKDGKAAVCGHPRDVMDRTFFADVFGVEAEVIRGKGFLIHGNIENELEEKKHEKVV